MSAFTVDSMGLVLSLSSFVVTGPNLCISSLLCFGDGALGFILVVYSLCGGIPPTPPFIYLSLFLPIFGSHLVILYRISRGLSPTPLFMKFLRNLGLLLSSMGR